MRKLFSVCGILAAVAGLALAAENYTGKLLDGSCYDQSKAAKGCDATGSTTQFVLDVGGKIFKLDAAGNAKAADAMKSRADRSANPDRAAGSAINAKVSGAKEGED